MYPGSHALKRDVDAVLEEAVLEENLITTKPLSADDDLKDVDICECAGWMAVIAVLG